MSYDHLGTVRLVTDSNANVVARHDYVPFGEEIPAGTAGRNSQWGAGNDNLATKFTGQMRDSETGEDYFNARYFSGALGRFNSPDPANAGADLTNPQSWNGYAYVLNNPLGLVDPSGMTCQPLGDGSYYDDSDGQGCDAAGVGAGDPNDPQTLNQNQVNAEVTAQNPSTLEYLWTISTNQIPTYVENDVPLSNNAQQVLTQVYRSVWPISQPLCSAGVFRYQGRSAEAGFKGFNVHGGAYGVVDANTATGISVGGIAEAGVTAFGVSVSGGKEVSKSVSSGTASISNVGFLGVGPVTAFGASGSAPEPGVLVGGDAGVGAYVVPSFINGCRGN